jgi:hypothetical protein
MQGKQMRGLDPRQKHISGHHRFQQFTPEGMDIYQQLFGMLGPDSDISRLANGDEGAFAQSEGPALRQFSALQGGLASRFSGAGMGARRSSGFQNTANQASSDFAQSLQANRQNLQRQAMSDLYTMSHAFLGQQPYGLQERQQKQSSGWGSVLGGLAGGALGATTGNPFWALQGAQLGSGIGGSF